MGLLEIQVPARAPPACAALVGPCDTASAKPVRSLVVAPGPWLDNGSRMSREVHVRFCESGGVQFPSATHRVVLSRWRPAEAYMPSFEGIIERLKLQLSAEKTRIVEAESGFDFLGVHFVHKPTRRP